MATIVDNGRVDGGLVFLSTLGYAASQGIGDVTATSTVLMPSLAPLGINNSFGSFLNEIQVGFSAVDSVYGVVTGSTTYYRKRARDSSCLTAQYVYWTTTDPNGAYAGILPCGGPLVDTVIVEVFQQ